ncbi:NUDIX hydrolase [Streptomyces sp. 8K308]|uniref:NUDIX domain-containing protein n=1 Tax=Streptomyces sp. 8K308 TaxID=2530388 RepID=UPI0010478E63|nr:NUDIX hydrolase [Streptomyces sp. 8K308]TDC23366.1 NUDIX hydrolase [Streptomyces sp. 8K308]
MTIPSPLSDPSDLSDYDRSLPRKRVSAGALFLDGVGRVLLVDPVYKEPWEIPGGAVEEDESPRDGAVREIEEELGLVRPLGRLLAVDWTGPRPGRSEGLTYVYDGGPLSPAEVAGIRLPADELRAFAFVEPALVGARLVPVLARRVGAALAARAEGRTAELREGVVVPDAVRG